MAVLRLFPVRHCRGHQLLSLLRWTSILTTSVLFSRLEQILSLALSGNSATAVMLQHG